MAMTRESMAEDSNASATAEKPRRISLSLALVAVGAFELWGLLRYFPIASWLSSNPFYTNSYAMHFARGLLGEASMTRHFRLWSYSPYLMAGYPAGTRTEPMGDALAMLFWIGHPIATEAILYKLFVIGMLLTAPIVMAFAARWLGLDWRVATISGALGVLGLFNLPGVLMIRAGMFGFLSASFLSVGWGAFLYRTIERGGWWRFVALALSGGALTYFHPLTPILMVPPALAGLIESHRSRRFLAIAASLAAAFAISLEWLVPMLLTLSIGVHFSEWWQSPRTLLGGLGDLFKASLPFPPIVVAAAALYGFRQSNVHQRFAQIWIAATIAFATLAYFGSSISSLETIAPGRFQTSFYFYSVPFAAVGIHRGWNNLRAMNPTWRPIARFVVLAAAAYFMLVSVASVWVETTVYGPIATTLPSQADEIAGWIAAHDHNSRLMLEAGWTRNKFGAVQLPYFGADLGLLWASRSGVQLVGGSPTEDFSTFSFVDFGNGKAFGKLLSQLPSDQFRRQLEIYSVSAVIAWSPDAKQYLAQVEDLNLARESFPFSLYEVAGPHNFFVEGTADSVTATQDCISIKQARPGHLVLKYHYFRTLRASPPMRVSSVSIDNGDPNPFIAIDNNTIRDIQIYNAGFTGRGRAATACR
jgi:hypothetical protein